MATKLQPLSPTDWLLMRCLWELEAANPLEVAAHLRTRFQHEMSAKTVGILLARLVDKGYLLSTPAPSPLRGRPPLVYSPLTGYTDSLRRQIQKFLKDHLIGNDELDLVETLLAERRDAVPAG